MSTAIAAARQSNVNEVRDVRRHRRQSPISPRPTLLIDALRRSASKNSCAHQSTRRISDLPRHQILIQIVAHLSSRLSRYTRLRAECWWWQLTWCRSPTINTNTASHQDWRATPQAGVTAILSKSLRVEASATSLHRTAPTVMQGLRYSSKL